MEAISKVPSLKHAYNCASLTISSYLFVVSEPAHDRGIHNAIEEHGEGVDGKVWVIKMALDHVVDLFIG